MINSGDNSASTPLVFRYSHSFAGANNLSLQSSYFSCTAGAALTHSMIRISPGTFLARTCPLVDESIVSNISVFSSLFFVSVRSPSLLSDATGPLSSPSPRRRPLSMYFQPAPIYIVVFTAYTLNLVARVWLYQHHPAFLEGAHDLCMAWHSYGG